MTKADLAEKIRDNLGLPKKYSIELVESVLEIMKSTLEAGDEIKISGFGIFKVRNKDPRQGRNPQTAAAMIIEGRKVLSFKASPVLKEAVNN